MVDKKEIGIVEFDRTELYFVAKKLEDIAVEIDKLSEDEKKFIIERIYSKNPEVISKVCNTMIDYMGW